MTEISQASEKTPWLAYGLLIPGAVVVLDQLTKFGATRFFGEKMNVCGTNPQIMKQHDLSPLGDIALFCNEGISWGLLQGDSSLKRWFLTIFAFAMSGLLYYALSQTKDRFSRTALALVIGGAIGNAIDRLLFGAVTDFIDFSDIGFNYIFNVADSAITVGLIGLIVGSFVTDRREKQAAKDRRQNK